MKSDIATMSGATRQDQRAASASVDVLVLGAGAAGLMCAIEAAKRGRRVLVLERNRAVGEKIRISGGGRCNFTNLQASPAQYVSENPRFCTSALARFGPGDFIALVEKHGIAYHEKKLGQLFCDGSSNEIIQMLLRELAWAGGEVYTGVDIQSVLHTGKYSVQSSSGGFSASALVVATGGLSIPKMGATDLGHRIATQFGLKLTPCAPALAPLVWGPEDQARYGLLAGVAAPAVVSCNGAVFEENMLFTHRGLSGPAILQASSYWQPGQEVSISLLPALPVGWLQQRKEVAPRQELVQALSTALPRRLAQQLCDTHAWRGVLGELPNRRLREMEDTLRGWRVRPAGTEGYAKAEVTRGGVATSELSPKTMAAHKAPGLYFIGEVVDVTGWLGGYNFQWAWASGHAAGQAV